MTLFKIDDAAKEITKVRAEKRKIEKLEKELKALESDMAKQKNEKAKENFDYNCRGSVLLGSLYN